MDKAISIYGRPLTSTNNKGLNRGLKKYLGVRYPIEVSLWQD